MFAILHALGMFVADLFKSRSRHPTAEWLARQITEAFPWTSAPAYLVRDSYRVLWTRLHVSGEGDGYPRSTDLSWVAVAEWLCRTLIGTCAASAWIKYSSSARRTCGEFFPPMRRITIKRAPTWH